MVDKKYTMPAEWSEHEATWICKPSRYGDWPGKFPAIGWVFVEIARRISPGEKVRIIVHSREESDAFRLMLERGCVDMSQVEFFRWKTDRNWTRDFGPLFVRPAGRAGELAIADFHFNGWAKYRAYKNDAKIASLAARRLKIPCIDVCCHGCHKNKFTLEGGGIDVNGAGTLITTEQCWLDETEQVRNRGMGRADYESVFEQYLGADNIIWLGRGIAGDDTHGHVDDLCRFVNQNTVIAVEEKNRSDENYSPLQENIRILKNSRLGDGRKLNVVTLPMPEPVFFDGLRLPASYANFYICNRSVLVPTFNDPADSQAIGILSELFPSRNVIGIHCLDLVLGQGTIHCLTQQQPVK